MTLNLAEEVSYNGRLTLALEAYLASMERAYDCDVNLKPAIDFAKLTLHWGQVHEDCWETSETRTEWDIMAHHLIRKEK